MSLNKPRFIGSASPFKGWAEKYFAAGYLPLPLPPNQKNPPPTGWTGHGRPFVDQVRLDNWLKGEDLRFKVERANIAIRLNSVVVDGVTWDLVIIDVDHHPEDVNDPKDGGTQLISLERQLGPLPDTWNNSARTNGISGHRIYRAPTGLAWRGDCGASGPDIDILSKNYRFSACFPSTNPDAKDAQYWWYPPGFAPNGDTDAIDREIYGWIPDPTKLPVLPDDWVNFLTNNRIPDFGVSIDMDSTNKQLNRWSIKNFGKPAEMCEYMRMQADNWIIKLQQSAKNHNILTKAHYHMLKCGAEEHHHGWMDAVKEFERSYEADCLDKGKRGSNIRTIKREIERSRYGALRRIKGEADEYKSKGMVYFASIDPCDLVRNSPVFQQHSDKGDDNEPPDHFGYYPHLPAKDPDTYENTDWGNAEWFRDLYRGYVRKISNAEGWIIWNNEGRWVRSQKAVPRGLFTRVKIGQYELARKKKIAAAGNAGAMKAADAYLGFAKKSGSLQGVTNALNFAGTMEGVEVKLEQLDHDRRAMGCDNGVIKWANGTGEITVIENTRELLITRNTRVEYIPLKDQATHKDSEVRAGYAMLGRFLKAVQPERNRRDYLQKILGQCLLGSNPHKIALFFYGPKNTGKTTLLELMLKAIGEYGDIMPTHLYQQKVLNPILAAALPLRIVGTDELGNSKIGSDLFKTITGNGTVTVEMKGSNIPITSQPQFTPIITTNTVPSVPGEDAAFRDRLVVIPFQNDVRGKGGDPYMFKANLEDHCAKAMLAWLIEGCSRAIAEGIRPFPEWIAKATGEFSEQLSDTSIFIRDHIKRTDSLHHFVPHSDLWSEYQTWAMVNGFDIRSKSSAVLSKELISQGFWPSATRPYVEGKQSRGWLGFKMRNVKSVSHIELEESGKIKK